VRPNGSVLERHDIPPAPTDSSPTGAGHDLDLGVERQGHAVFTAPAARTADWHTPVRCTPIRVPGA